MGKGVFFLWKYKKVITQNIMGAIKEKQRKKQLKEKQRKKEKNLIKLVNE